MKPIRFSLSTLFGFILVIAFSLGWWIDRSQLANKILNEQKRNALLTDKLAYSSNELREEYNNHLATLEWEIQFMEALQKENAETTRIKLKLELEGLHRGTKELKQKQLPWLERGIIQPNNQDN